MHVTYSSVRIERFLVMGFLSLILAGTFALWIVNNMSGMYISLLDAMFMITSAVCVTGLASVDAGTALSLGGQLVLLASIQLGGLGVMAATTALPIMLGMKLGLRGRILLAGGFGLDTPQGAVRLLKIVLRYTLCIEAAMAVPLFIGFMEKESFGRALYLAVFHSISGFCNAGFSLYADNLAGFSSSLLVPGSIMLLIVLGGIGFPVLAEFERHFKNKNGHFFSPYSKLVISTTACLIIAGTALIYLSEYNRAFAGMPQHLKIWNALFTSISPRTAGFETVPMTTYSGMGIAVIMFLMFVGASPCSTGGGIKTTTFGILVVSSWSEIRGFSESIMWHRSIAQSTERKAIAVTTLYLSTLLIGTLMLNFTESHSFTALLFESFSAMGTVGLSMGVTPTLSPPGKVIIILLMFWGRVGIISFLFGIFAENKPSKVGYIPTYPPIG